MRHEYAGTWQYLKFMDTLCGRLNPMFKRVYRHDGIGEMETVIAEGQL